MALQNKWVNYVDRSYQQIKDSLIDKLKINAVEVTDHSESNILIIILSMFAGVAEMLNYYIDNMAREAFIGTARRFSSMVKLVRLLDYRVAAASAASADITFTFNNPASSAGLIPIGTPLKTANNIEFLVSENKVVPLGATSVVVGAIQITKIIGSNLGTTNGSANQAFPLGVNYVRESCIIKINSISWFLVNTLGLSVSTDKHFIVEIDVDGIAYVVFGDGTNGEIPPVSQSVIADFQETVANLGNADPNTITTLVSTPIIPGVSSITVTNLNGATGGAPYETLERIRISAPLSIRTLDRAVTEQDYVDIAKLAPGVGKAAIYFNCGKTVKVYIVPIGGGIAQSPLLTSTDNWFEPRRMVTTFIDVLAAGPMRLYINMTVTGKFREDSNQILADVQAALVDYGAYLNQTINKRVRVSDIIALIDNLDKVDFLTLNTLAGMPYAEPQGHTNQLNWTRLPVAGTTKVKWTIQWTGTDYTLYKDNTFMGLYSNFMSYVVDSMLQVSFGGGAYSVGDTWVFYTYPINVDIPTDDYTIPYVDINDLYITVNTQMFQPIE